MARTRRNQYRSSLLPALMIGGTAIGLLGLAGLTIAWSMGAFASETQQRAEDIDRTGQLAFPALAQTVPAFEAISREHLIDPRTGQLKIIWLSESNAEVVSRDVSDLIGRVLKRDKDAGMVLTEFDFLPIGTKPGVSAGIPPGKFAATIPTSGIPGLEQLRHGDRFDLMVSLQAQTDDRGPSGNTEPAAVFGGIKPPSLRVGQLSRQHGVKRLVTSGQLITLTNGKQHSTKGSNGLTINPSSKKGTPTTATYAEIAIDEEEIGPLTEAISMNTPLTCIVRSGHADAEIEESFSREGLVPVITTASKVDAYAELTDEALIDSATGQLHYYYFPPERVPDHWLTDPTQVYGRVVSRSLRRGAPITEADLLPAGTKPGISAGVPPGMVAMAVNTDQIAGFDDLVQGDRFAIHAKVPDSSAKPINSTWVNLQGGSLSPETERLEQMLSSGIREVVPQAVYLRVNDDGTATIAVPEDRIAQVAQLIRDKADLFVVARSAEEDWSAQRHVPLNQLAVEPTTLAAGTQHNVHHTQKPKITATRKEKSQAHFPATLVATQLGTPAADRVQVPILTRDVSAFEPLAIDDFVDPATGQIRYVFFSAGQVKPEWMTDIRQLIDRVTRRALKSGRTVSEADLAPPGSPAGPSAGVPIGMEGVVVDSSQIEDLDLLRPGARFDIISGRAIQPGALGDRVRRTLSSADAVAEADKLPSLGVQVSREVTVGALLLAELGSTDRVRRETVNGRRTTTRTTATGGIEEVQVDEQPQFETSTQTVTRFAIAVPRNQAATLISFLNRRQPLRMVLRRAEPSQRLVEPDQPQAKPGQPQIKPGQPPNDFAPMDTPAIRTYVREHFSGSESPESEVFVSDRTYPLPFEATLIPDGPSGVIYE